MANKVSLIDAWINAIKPLAKESFMPLKGAGEIPVHIRLSSEGWYEKLLRPEAGPYKVSNQAEHSFRPSNGDAPDLLRHEYGFGEYQIVILESRNFIMLTAQDLLSSTSQEEKVRQAEALANAVLRMKGEGYQLQFKFPAGNPERFYFSTNPDADIVFLRTWHDRVDGYVENRSVTLICFKRIEQLVGFQDDRDWFDKSFRERFALAGPKLR